MLTRSLAGMDHKLHIILNKVDRLKNYDFAGLMVPYAGTCRKSSLGRFTTHLYYARS